MRIVKTLALAFGCCAIAACPVTALAEPVSVAHSGSDALGKRLAVELTQEVMRHPDLTATAETDRGWKIVLVTIANDGATTFSVSLVNKAPEALFDYYVTSFVGVCGAQRLESCAGEIVAKVLEPIDAYERNWREFAEADDPADTAELANNDN